MEINLKRIKYKSRSDRFMIVPIGDCHLGSCNCDLDKLKRLLEWCVATPNVYVILMGDLIECISYAGGEKRFDQDTIAEPYKSNLPRLIQLQTEDILTIFEPLAKTGRILGYHRGNHEESARKKYTTDICYELWREWKGAIPMLKDVALTRLQFERLGGTVSTLDIFSAHGNVAGRTEGSKINRLTNIMSMFDADVYFIAHGHSKLTLSKSVLGLNHTDEMRLVERKKVAGMTGSFLKTYGQNGTSCYAEKSLYPPSALGVIKVTFSPMSYDLHISE